MCHAIRHAILNKPCCVVRFFGLIKTLKFLPNTRSPITLKIMLFHFKILPIYVVLNSKQFQKHFVTEIGF